MATRNGRPRRAVDLDGLIAETVAEAWDRSGFDEDRGWRRHGFGPACDRTLNDLAIARGESRRLLEGSAALDDDGNEFALGAAENRVNYVIGDGFTYEATGPDPALTRDFQEFIDAFVELNALDEIEPETLWRCDVDGEAFWRLFPAAGVPEVRAVPPERVRPPADADIALRDPWGVHTDPADHTRRLLYWVEPAVGAEPEAVPEADVLHLTFNVTSASLRGWPTWEPIARALRRAEDLLVAGTVTGKAQAKLALLWKRKNLSRERADQIVTRLTTRDWDRADYGCGDGDLPRRPLTSIQELPYGAVLNASEGDEITVPAAADPSYIITLIQANLRAAGARLSMPEWMFSGVADQKFANAFVGEGPTLRCFKRLQRKLAVGLGEGRFRRRASLVWRAARMAVRFGVLPADVLRLCRVKVTPPTLEVRDKQAEAQTNQIYIAAGVKPVPLVQQELGYDPAALAELRRKYPDPAPGPSPTGGGAAKAGDAGAGDATGGDDPAARSPARASGAGDTTTTAEAHLRGVAGWAAEAARWGATDADFDLPAAETIVTPADLAEWVAEARDLSKLVKKVVTTSRGHKMTVYVRPNDSAVTPRRPSAAGRAAAEQAARGLLGAGAKLDAESAAALAGHLKNLTVEQIRGIKRDHGVTGGAVKQELIGKFIAHATGTGGTPPPVPPVMTPPVPPPPPVPDVSGHLARLAAAGVKPGEWYDRDAVAAKLGDTGGSNAGTLAVAQLVQAGAAELRQGAGGRGQFRLVPATPPTPAQNTPPVAAATPPVVPDAAGPGSAAWHQDPSHPVAREIAADPTAPKVAGYAVHAAAADRMAAVRDRDAELWAAADGKPASDPAMQAWLAHRDETRAVRDEYDALTERVRGEVAEQFRPASPVRLDISHAAERSSWNPLGILVRPADRADELIDGQAMSGLDRGSAFVQSVAGEAGRPLAVEVGMSRGGRAFVLSKRGLMDRPLMGLGLIGKPEDSIHEFGHLIEDADPAVRARANAFLAYRVGGERYTDIGSLPGAESMKGEKGRKNHFDRAMSEVDAYYTGKTYGKSTEVISTGLERLYKDPVRFLSKDPEYATFVLSAIRGKS